MKTDEPLPDPQGLTVTDPPNRRHYSSVQCLLDAGWTQAAIEKFLPVVPDVIGPYRLGEPGDPPMKHWLRRRVSQVRLTDPKFREWRLRADQARANQKVLTDEEDHTRRQSELIARLNSLKP